MNTREQVALNVYAWKKQGLRVGMASGAFDLFHAGHLSFLTGLRGHVDRLVVAVMSDEACNEKKYGRPIIPAVQRVAIVSALQCVDDAFVFPENGDERNIELVLPNVFSRGDGHGPVLKVSGTLARLGIETILIHTPRITSTSEIIARIHDRR